MSASAVPAIDGALRSGRACRPRPPHPLRHLALPPSSPEGRPAPGLAPDPPPGRATPRDPGLPRPRSGGGSRGPRRGRATGSSPSLSVRRPWPGGSCGASSPRCPSKPRSTGPPRCARRSGIWPGSLSTSSTCSSRAWPPTSRKGCARGRGSSISWTPCPWAWSGAVARNGDRRASWRVWKRGGSVATNGSSWLPPTARWSSPAVTARPSGRGRAFVSSRTPWTSKLSPSRARDREPATIVFTGNMGYFPNVNAAVWFAREVLPRVREVRPEARFLIVGTRPARAVRDLAKDPAVVVTGRVEDVGPYLRRATLAVAPMRSGSGQQFKILEAMASGAPVVATAAEAEQVGAEPGRELLVADEAAAFAAAVVALLNDPARARGLAERARRLVEERFTWRRSVDALEAVYREALLERSPGTAAGASPRDARDGQRRGRRGHGAAGPGLDPDRPGAAARPLPGRRVRGRFLDAPRALVVPGVPGGPGREGSAGGGGGLCRRFRVRGLRRRVSTTGTWACPA